MNKTNLILLTYGAKTEHYRAIFCILSFFAHYKGDIKKIRINVYTDDVGLFGQYLTAFDINYFPLTPLILNEMLGTTTYIHRRKVMVIMKTFEKYPGDKLLFIDSDAFFCNDPEMVIDGISENLSFMHKREYSFAEGLKLFASFNQADAPQAFIEFVEASPLTISGTSEYVDRNDYCWNSGILGLHYKLVPLLGDVLRLTDEFYKYSNWFISEQLAFSVVLNRKSHIETAESIVVHYWGKRQKKMMDELLFKKLLEFKAREADAVHIRRLTRKWKSAIIDDLLKEKAVIALSQGSWKYGIKRLLIAVFRNPGNISLLRELRQL